MTEPGDPPETGAEYLDRDAAVAQGDGTTIRVGPDVGDNSVFVDGIECWRRYRFGGWIPRRDDHDCESPREFQYTHRGMDVSTPRD